MINFNFFSNFPLVHTSLITPICPKCFATSSSVISKGSPLMNTSSLSGSMSSVGSISTQRVSHKQSDYTLKNLKIKELEFVMKLNSLARRPQRPRADYLFIYSSRQTQQRRHNILQLLSVSIPSSSLTPPCHMSIRSHQHRNARLHHSISMCTPL